ncbi:MAG TPA: sigma-70 family RNA polymerase sigma factor [Flavisolibacter sp.]|nr:sigma-70 family RNA polymerase sigma factor [Flavisolibacter sp.]
MIQEDENIDTIINGCKKGSRKAQEKLYKSYYRVMASLCLRYTKNEADAVEVLNNGFLKVFKNIQRYEPAQASLYTWIRTIVINSCLDFIKAKQRMEQTKELTDTVEIHIPAEAISKMKTMELLELVRQLPPATRAVFNLYVVEGYSHREIGSLLGISEGTSKWHLSEARKILQQKIKLQDVKHS